VGLRPTPRKLFEKSLTKNFKRNALCAFLGFLLLSAIIILSACGVGSSPPPELLTPVAAQISLDTAIAVRGPIADVERRMGIVRTESIPVNFGAVTASFYSFYVRPGDEVSYGQLLARLDMTHFEEQISHMEAAIARMRGWYEFDNDLAALNLDIQARMGMDVSQGRLELTFGQERQALSLSHAEADLQAFKSRLYGAELRAPFDGTISLLSDFSKGSWVTSFEPVLYIVPSDAAVFIECLDVTPINIRATRIQAHIDGAVYDTTRLPTTVEQMLRYGRIPARFSLDSGEMPPVGSLVPLYVYNNWEEDVLRLPRNVLFSSRDIGFYVYRVVDGQREMVAITVGMRTDSYIEVLSGIEEGDEIYVRS